MSWKTEERCRGVYWKVDELIRRDQKEITGNGRTRGKIEVKIEKKRVCGN